MIIYTATQSEWENIQGQVFFSSPSLQSEGFIHCCYPEQVLWVLNKHFQSDEWVWLLCIDEQQLASELRVEDLKSLGEGFPHVYGEINANAVTREVKMFRDLNGTYFLSNELKQLYR